MRGRWIAVGVVCAAGFSAALVGLGLQTGIGPVAAAAAKSQAAGGAKVALTVSADTPKGAVTVTANGVVDQGQADITADLSQVMAAGGLPGGNGSVELRYLQENGDPVVYANAPALTAMIPGGKSWVRLDLEQLGKVAGVDLNQMISQAAQNPADVLDLLRSAGSVDTVGTDTVDGVQTTHYRATIDLAKAASVVGSPATDAVQHLIAQGGPSTIPVDVWIGADGLVRKVTVDETVSQNGQTASAHLTLGLSDYGTAVSITAPPSGDTLDATGLLSLAAQRLQSG